MIDLVTWFRAQMDADEANALAACQGDGYREWDNPSTGVVQVAGGDLEGLVLAPRNAALHMAVHDPARVLRQVAAMRKIVELHSPERVWTGSGYEDGKCTTCLISQSDLYGSEYETAPCPTLRALAGIYADRDGYGEWAPE